MATRHVPNEFSNVCDAVLWLSRHGWYQNAAGAWLKGSRHASIHRMFTQDGVYSLSFTGR